jgi:hypothetical protein
MTYSYPTDDNENRVRGVVDRLIGTESPDDIMSDLLEVLTEGGKTPEAGKFYTFLYFPKTPNIQYDEHPLVYVTAVFSWGFKAESLHWGEPRQYTYNEIVGGLYEIYPEEMSDVVELNYAKIRSK